MDTQTKEVALKAVKTKNGDGVKTNHPIIEKIKPELFVKEIIPAFIDFMNMNPSLKGKVVKIVDYNRNSLELNNMAYKKAEWELVKDCIEINDKMQVMYWNGVSLDETYEEIDGVQVLKGGKFNIDRANNKCFAESGAEYFPKAGELLYVFKEGKKEEFETKMSALMATDIEVSIKKIPAEIADEMNIPVGVEFYKYFVQDGE